MKEFISPTASLDEACRKIKKWEGVEQYAVRGKD